MFKGKLFGDPNRDAYFSSPSWGTCRRQIWTTLSLTIPKAWLVEDNLLVVQLFALISRRLPGQLWRRPRRSRGRRGILAQPSERLQPDPPRGRRLERGRADPEAREAREVRTAEQESQEGSQQVEWFVTTTFLLEKRSFVGLTLPFREVIYMTNSLKEILRERRVSCLSSRRLKKLKHKSYLGVIGPSGTFKRTTFSLSRTKKHHIPGAEDLDGVSAGLVR